MLEILALIKLGFIELLLAFLALLIFTRNPIMSLIGSIVQTVLILLIVNTIGL